MLQNLSGTFFKSDERILWIYKNIYRWWISLTVRKSSNIIVQTEWMKEALVARNYNKDKILIAKQDINNIQTENIEVKNMMRTYYSIQQLIINIKIIL